MGAMGGEEGAFPWYGGLALICLFQAAYPTLLGWTLVTVVYLFCSAIFVYLTIADLIELIRGGRASIFVNPVDDAVFSSLVVACLAIAQRHLHRPSQVAAAPRHHPLTKPILPA